MSRSLVFTKTGQNYSSLKMAVMLCNREFSVSLPWTLIYKILDFLPEELKREYYEVTERYFYGERTQSSNITIDSFGNCWVPCRLFGENTYNQICRNYICIYSPDNFTPTKSLCNGPHTDAYISDITCDRCEHNIDLENDQLYYEAMEEYEGGDLHSDRCDCGNIYYGRRCQYCK